MKTKSILSLLAFVSAAVLPAAATAELAGVTLPASVDTAHLFLAFVVVLVGATAIADYSRPGRSRRLVADGTATSGKRTAEKAVHALAA